MRKFVAIVLTLALAASLLPCAILAESKAAPDTVVFINIGEAYATRGANAFSKQVHDAIVERINVDVQFIYVAADQYQNRVNMMLASGEQLDVLPRVSVGQAIDYYNDEVIYDLSDWVRTHGQDYLNACQSHPFIAKAREEGLYQGKDLFMPWPAQVPIGNLLLIRNDWLENLGMDLPSTIPEYAAYLEAVKARDPDGNGQADTYGLVGQNYSALTNVFAQFYLPKGPLNWVDEAGLLQPAIAHEAYAQMLGDLAGWYQAGYIPKDMFTAKSDQVTDWITGNQAGSYVGWYSGTANPSVILQEMVPEVHYKVICLQGPEGAANAYYSENAAASGCVIPKYNSKNPEAAMRWLNDLYTREGQILSMYGIEGVTYEVRDGQPVDSTDAEGNVLYGAVYNPMIQLMQICYGLFAGIRPFQPFARRTVAELSEMPSFDAPDKLVRYDKTRFESQAVLTDLDTFIDEQRTKILVGELTADQWPAILQQWRAMGGDAYIQDINIQYKEFIAQ